MNKGLMFAVVSLLVVAGAAAYRSFSASGSSETSEDENVVYICQETGKVLRAPADQIPALNPETGHNTLYRALYCGTCAKWYPLPPPDARNANPLGYRCPKHDTAMSTDGPIPNRP
jgi:hypothetical protein